MLLRRALSVALVASLLANNIQPALCQLGASEMLPGLTPLRFNPAAVPGRNVNKPIEQQTLEDLFRKVDLKTTSGQPVDLGTTKIPGLSTHGVSLLAFNYFVESSGQSYTKLSDIYTENKREGKPNFVTVDSVLHPYFAFSNGMLASAIEESAFRDLKQLLNAMISSSITDYRRTEDDEVKDDIQRNLAYLSVAMKLLEPRAALPDIGGGTDLVQIDYSLVGLGKKARSSIFNIEVDFSAFKPWGWMAQREKTRRFYTAYQWLSRMHFSLSNTTDNSLKGGGNSFRRAVLLYHSLITADLGTEAGLTRWNRLATLCALTGFDGNAKKKTIVPPELTPLLSKNENDLDKLLFSLSQPFLRTKLMLAVRKQRPLELNARSVFEIGSKDGGSGEDLVFRFFPKIDPPELDWLRENAHGYVEPEEGPTSTPLSLLFLHALGAQQATNLLSEQMETLDKGLAKSVPRLERLLKLDSPDDNQDRHRAIVSSLFRQYPDTVQVGLRSELWLTRTLETSVAAWLDSYDACLVIPPGQGSPNPGPSPSSPPKTGSGQANGNTPPSEGTGSSRSASGNPSPTAAPRVPAKPVAKARFHYLEPRQELYRRLHYDCQNLVTQLTQLQYFPARYQGRANDFQRLFKRLTQIADLEARNEPISIPDFNLLANIDQVLGPVDSPVASYLYLDISSGASAGGASPEKKESGGPADKMAVPAQRTGATLGLGRAGKLYIICSTSKGPMLTRGGCYTFYEIQGGPVKDEHWERKLTYGLLQPPFWTKKFGVVMEEEAQSGVQVNKDQSQSGSPQTRL